MKYLVIDKKKIPCEFRAEINGERLAFRVRFNRQASMFTLDLWDADGEQIAYGRPLLYGRDVLRGLANIHTCGLGIVCADPQGLCMNDGVTESNFMVEVKPYITGRVQ